MCEELYSADVATLDQIEKNIRELAKDIGRHSERIAKLEGRADATPKADNWLKRNAYWITPSISIASMTVAIIALVFGSGFIIRHISLTIDERVESKLSGPKNQIQQLQLDLKGISTKIDTFFELRLRKLAGVRPSDAWLAEVQQAVHEADVLNVSVSPAVIDSLRLKLQAINSSSPIYWPTVFQYLHLAGNSITPLDTSKMSTLDLGKGMVDPRNMTTVDNLKVIIRGGKFEGITFKQCLIEFEAQETVPLRNVRFVDCVFRFPVVTNPNRYLREAARSLLASDLKELRIANLSASALRAVASSTDTVDDLLATRMYCTSLTGQQ